MRKWGKRKDEEADAGDSDGGGGGGGRPSKKAAKNASDDTDSITVCELPKSRKVSVRKWQGKIMVDIREFYTTKDGKEMPGKKGISLSMDQWNILKDHVAEIDKVLADNA